jgi:hypothetical protein
MQQLRRHLGAMLDGGHAYARAEGIVGDVPVEVRGRVPQGGDHSLWELLEHLRIAQRDILDFCVAPSYDELRWPDEYWPKSVEPQNEEEWNRSVRGFLDDLAEARRLAVDPSIDLYAVVKHGTTQTWLRELLLIAEHNAYHLGQIVVVRKLLGAWEG